MAVRFPEVPENNIIGGNCEKQTQSSSYKQSLNLVLAKYCDLSVANRLIICQSQKLRQITDLHPIIINYVSYSVW